MSRRALPFIGLITSVLLPLAMGCGGERNVSKDTSSEGAPEPSAQVMTHANLARARSAADALVQGLMGELVQALEAGGPPAALSYCADSAQALTKRFQEQGLTVRRVGTRVRNPANTPNSKEEAILARFQRTIASGETPSDTAFTAVGPEGRAELRYLRPIQVGEPCLACHGDKAAMAPELRATLAERYPEDRATGYQVGDLRGALSVKIRAK